MAFPIKQVFQSMLNKVTDFIKISMQVGSVAEGEVEEPKMALDVRIKDSSFSIVLSAARVKLTFIVVGFLLLNLLAVVYWIINR
jgi:hypothetical protein